MVIELGLFALIVSVLLATAQAWVGLAGATSAIDAGWPRASARHRAAGVRRPVVRRAELGVLQERLLGPLRGEQFELRIADLLPLHRGVGRTRGFAAAVDADAVDVVVAVGVFSRSLPETFVARVLGVLGIVSIGFPLFILLTSNPFERLIPAPADGRDLNPLLQDPALVIHPPMLYMGYVGFSVAFAFAIAALLEGGSTQRWARWSRPWTTAAWCSSPSASRSAAGGPTTNSAGAAGGSGTRWRTRRSCRGWSAPR